ncbi:Thg1 C terminal domain-containing protein [Cunninghamella echinulata]|nr:Thg1 C terminal domain-containing protein [Cunninghamella echinulata]
MNHCAIEVMKEIHDISIAYGQSDEYSFVISKSSNLYSRRASKLVSTIGSLFTSNYVMNWSKFFKGIDLKYAPCFDSRSVCYPSDQNLRDYLSWRQADCHINNLYNTTFWSIVQGGKSEKEAEDMLRGTFSKDKHEILFNQYNTNYNKIEPIYKKGSTIIRLNTQVSSVSPRTGETVQRTKKIPTAIYDDIIGDEFWLKHSDLLK